MLCLAGAIIPRFRRSSMVRALAGAGLLTLGLVLSGNAQRGGGSAAGQPPNPNAEMSSGVGKYANWDQLAAHQHGSLYFAGKVAMGAGSLPWDPIPVIVTCNNVVRYDTHTDAKGAFEIEAAA